MLMLSKGVIHDYSSCNWSRDLDVSPAWHLAWNGWGLRKGRTGHVPGAQESEMAAWEISGKLFLLDPVSYVINVCTCEDSWGRHPWWQGKPQTCSPYIWHCCILGYSLGSEGEFYSVMAHSAPIPPQTKHIKLGVEGGTRAQLPPAQSDAYLPKTQGEQPPSSCSHVDQWPCKELGRAEGSCVDHHLGCSEMVRTQNVWNLLSFVTCLGTTHKPSTKERPFFASLQ